MFKNILLNIINIFFLQILINIYIYKRFCKQIVKINFIRGFKKLFKFYLLFLLFYVIFDSLCTWMYIDSFFNKVTDSTTPPLQKKINLVWDTRFDVHLFSQKFRLFPKVNLIFAHVFNLTSLVAGSPNENLRVSYFIWYSNIIAVLISEWCVSQSQILAYSNRIKIYLLNQKRLEIFQ